MNGKELLAAVNASLNGTSTILIVLAFVMVKRRQFKAHATMMVAALTTSAAFLVVYLYSYYAFGDRSSGLQSGTLKTFYLCLLASHVLLAIVVLPPIFMTVWRAYAGRWDAHRKIARPTFWIWLYVSVTGVLVYWMLYHLFPSMR